MQNVTIKSGKLAGKDAVVTNVRVPGVEEGTHIEKSDPANAMVDVLVRVESGERIKLTYRRDNLETWTEKYSN